VALGSVTVVVLPHFLTARCLSGACDDEIEKVALREVEIVSDVVPCEFALGNRTPKIMLVDFDIPSVFDEFHRSGHAFDVERERIFDPLGFLIGRQFSLS
jgi:hypothetical protein